MGKYFDEVKRSMEWLAEDPRTIFLGQAVGCPGTFMYGSVADIPAERRVEIPVSESLQMQMTLGISLAGGIPISIFPRQNFLLLATSDMVNMIDKMAAISDGAINPQLIIRTAVGTTAPIHPGHQHVGNFSAGLRSMFTTIDVVELHEPEQIYPTYQKALENRGPTLIIEFGDHLSSK
jgi:pyruvate/2-oxoglutarate/acetoin dehydrogenase E1 component